MMEYVKLLDDKAVNYNGPGADAGFSAIATASKIFSIPTSKEKLFNTPGCPQCD
jgi:hypothetical protein